MALLCEKVDADVHQVARGMGLDKRIGGKFLHPGPGFGGSCFPKDTHALLAIGESHDVDLKVIRAAVDVNERQASLMHEKIRHMAGGEVNGLVVGLLGLAFKPNTSDVRESPAVRIAERLLREGARVKAYDPAGMDEIAGTLEGLELMHDEYAVAEGSDVLVLATEWNQFRQLDLQRIRKSLRKPVVVDLRNIYEPADMKRLGFEYTGVGR
jgi:UDPglucose 6-dehydrogenase